MSFFFLTNIRKITNIVTVITTNLYFDIIIMERKEFYIKYIPLSQRERDHFHICISIEFPSNTQNFFSITNTKNQIETHGGDIIMLRFQ